VDACVRACVRVITNTQQIKLTFYDVKSVNSSQPIQVLALRQFTLAKSQLIHLT